MYRGKAKSKKKKKTIEMATVQGLKRLRNINRERKTKQSITVHKANFVVEIK